MLVILAIPVFSLRLGFADAGNRQPSDTTRKAYDLLSEGFGPGFNGSFFLVLETPGGAKDASTISDIKSAIEATPGVASVTNPQPLANGQLNVMYVFPTTSPQDKATTQLVHTLRENAVPSAVAGSDVHAYFTGLPPAVVDFSDYMGHRLPIFIGAVLLLSFLLLMTVFHSVVVPLKAVIMNMLSIGAAFGATVAVFQWGIGAGIIGLGKEGPVRSLGADVQIRHRLWLSMVRVFLLTRVREEYDRTGDNGRAVACDPCRHGPRYLCRRSDHGCGSAASSSVRTARSNSSASGLLSPYSSTPRSCDSSSSRPPWSCSAGRTGGPRLGCRAICRRFTRGRTSISRSRRRVLGFKRDSTIQRRRGNASIVRKALRAYWRWTIAGSPVRLLVGLGAPLLLLAMIVVMGDDQTRQLLQGQLSGTGQIRRLELIIRLSVGCSSKAARP